MLSVLKLTDGTNTVDFLDKSSGFHLIDWQPSFPQAKNGGVFRSSPFTPGRALVSRVLDNLYETMTVSVDAASGDALIADWNKVIDLLEAALDYWTSAANFTPVYIEAKGPCETNTRYAVVKNYSIPSLVNPYQPPFESDGTGRYVTPEIPITLELGLWTAYPPGDSICIPMSSQDTGLTFTDNQLSNPGFETAGAGGADVFANWTESAGDGAIARSLAVFKSGVASAQLTSGPNSDTHIYQDFTVVPGETFIFSFWTRGSGTNAGRYRVNCVTTGVDLFSLGTTGIAGTTFSLITGKWVVPATVVTIRIYLYCPAADGQAAYFDDVSARRSNGTVTFGMEQTCNLDEIHLGNCSSRAQITDIFVYDSPTFGSNIVGLHAPTKLLPTVPAAGDYLLIGIDASAPYPGPFCSVIFDLTTAIDTLQVSGTWEYMVGSTGTWTTIPAGTRLDDTALLSITGIRGLYFDFPSDFTPYPVNGINAYWIRYRVTSVGGAPTPPEQGNRPIYSAIYTHVDIDTADIPGTLPAILETITEKMSADIASTPITKVIYGSRVTGRGAEFNPHLLGSDVNQPLDADLDPLVVVTVGAQSSFIYPDAPAVTNKPAFPSGRVVQYLPGAATSAMAVRATWRILPDLAQEYFGRFRCFVWYQAFYSGASSTAFTLRLYYNNGARYTDDIPIVTSATDGIALAEFGVIDIFPDFDPAVDTVEWVDLALHVSHNVSTSDTLWIGGIILVPADETIYDAEYVRTTLANGYQLHIDGGMQPKRGNFASLETSGGLLTDIWRLTASGGIIINHKDDIRLWLLQGGPVELVSSIQGFQNPRYHIMRGAN